MRESSRKNAAMAVAKKSKAIASKSVSVMKKADKRFFSQAISALADAERELSGIIGRLSSAGARGSSGSSRISSIEDARSQMQSMFPSLFKAASRYAPEENKQFGKVLKAFGKAAGDIARFQRERKPPSFRDLISMLVQDNRDKDPRKIRAWARKKKGWYKKMVKSGRSEDDIIDALSDMLDREL